MIDLISITLWTCTALTVTATFWLIGRAVRAMFNIARAIAELAFVCLILYQLRRGWSH